MRQLESAQQRAYFQWARLHPIARRAFAIPNGGHRSKTTAAVLKAEGVRAGVFDTCLPVARGTCHGLYIEFKYGRNRMTPEQAKFADELVAEGYVAVVAYDWLVARRWTEAYLVGDLVPALIVDHG